MKLKSLLVMLLMFTSQDTMAQADQFTAGQIITEFGKVAQVNGMEALPEQVSFKVSFDVAKAAQKDQVNRSIDSVARFINMHAASGVPTDQINLAVVVHGSAVKDVTSDTNKQNKALIEALQNHQVQFYVCGQSAAYYGVKKADLIPGVKMSLSAMTAHALLQQQGFTLNPF